MVSQTTTVVAQDLETLRTQVQGTVLLPGEQGYEGASMGWDLSVRQNPAMIVLPKSADDIAAAVQYADQAGLWLAVASTGHGVIRPAGNNAMLIRTSEMDQVQIDAQAHTAAVQAGAKWGDVLAAAHVHGLAPLLGSSPTVGAVGYTLGGGLGWLARKYGLSTDHVLGFQVVTSDGRVLEVNREQNPDLFWAMRGGGGGFAIVTAMEIRLFPVKNVFGGALIYPGELSKEVFQRYSDWIKKTPIELTTSVRISNFPPVEMVPEFMRGKSFAMVCGCYCGPVLEGPALIKEWLDWGAHIDNSFRVMPFSEVASISNDPVDPLPAYHNGAWMKTLTDEAIDVLVEYGLSVQGSSPLVITEVRHVDGAMALADQNSNAFGYRNAPMVLDIISFAPSPEAYEGIHGYVGRFKEAMAPHIASGMYMNFGNAKEIEANTQAAFSHDRYRRLQAVKATYDPDNMLRSGFHILPNQE